MLRKENQPEIMMATDLTAEKLSQIAEQTGGEYKRIPKVTEKTLEWGYENEPTVTIPLHADPQSDRQLLVYPHGVYLDIDTDTRATEGVRAKNTIVSDGNATRIHYWDSSIAEAAVVVRKDSLEVVIPPQLDSQITSIKLSPSGGETRIAKPQEHDLFTRKASKLAIKRRRN